jgi:hypothetical protein
LAPTEAPQLKEMAIMRRRTFDALLTTAGLVLAAILLIAGVLLTWGHVFVSNQVHDQLAAQKITMPAGEAIAEPTIKPYLSQYAGQQLTNGAQAQAYANHFIAVHLQGIGGGKTYAELSAAALANPTDAKLAGQVATVFKGETLRGMLLNAYAFWKLGQLALYGAIAAFVGAGIMLLLSLLGFAHLRKVDPEVEVLAGPARRSAVATA